MMPPKLPNLSKEEIRRGMAALRDELGEEKGAAFLQAVADGALDARFEGPIIQWIRRNPTVALAGAALLGAGADALLRRAFHEEGRPSPEAARAQLDAAFASIGSGMALPSGPLPKLPSGD